MVSVFFCSQKNWKSQEAGQLMWFVGEFSGATPFFQPAVNSNSEGTHALR